MSRKVVRSIAVRPILLLLVAAFALAACATPPRPTAIGAPVATPPVVATRLTALTVGELTNDNECLTVNGYLLVWPPDLVVNFQGDTVEIVDKSTGEQTVWHSGDTVGVGGGIVPYGRLDEQVRQAIPSQCSTGGAESLWLVGGAKTPSPPSSTAVSPGSVADWESSALSIPELARAADAIVRARVVEAPASRTITQELPMVDEQGTPVATVTDSMLFSDTLFEVVNSYSGTLPAQIYVMQIGGTSPDGSVLNEFPDDPLYRVGDEYILFMVDISGDKVQAPDRELYRTVNPAGRFLIDGAKVRSFWADPAVAGTLPQTVDDLVTQIKQANP